MVTGGETKSRCCPGARTGRALGQVSPSRGEAASAGYAINAYDLRGHGRTGGPRVYAPSFEVLMGDVERHIEQTRQRFPGLPVFLYGHSLGGEQVLYYVLRRSPSLAGVIATSPLLAPGTPLSPLKVAGAKLLARLVPTKIITTEVPWDSLSRDAAVIGVDKERPAFPGGSQRQARGGASQGPASGSAARMRFLSLYCSSRARMITTSARKRPSSSRKSSPAM